MIVVVRSVGMVRYVEIPDENALVLAGELDLRYLAKLPRVLFGS